MVFGDSHPRVWLSTVVLCFAQLLKPARFLGLPSLATNPAEHFAGHWTAHDVLAAAGVEGGREGSLLPSLFQVLWLFVKEAGPPQAQASDSSQVLWK